MKFIHLADLHLGRRISGYSLLEDQEDILRQILRIIADEKPDCVLIAGDVYDKAVPPVEAVTMLDDFLNAIAEQNVRICLIAGNHDAPERLAFGSRLMNRSGVHVSPVYQGKAEEVVLTDAFGEVHIYLLPYLRPGEVRRFFPDTEIPDTAHAVAAAIAAMPVDPGQRNVIVSHQFVAGGTVCESEHHSVGGTDAVPAEVYAPFDYAALGHLHGPQHIGRESVRYSGTPLKYSLSEEKHHKSVTVVELGEKGSAPVIRECALKPLRDMHVLTLPFAELIQQCSDDYVALVLTDESRVPDAQQMLRRNYPHIMSLYYEHDLTLEDMGETQLPEADTEQASPLDLFSIFFRHCYNRDMTDEQHDYMQNLMESIWNEASSTEEGEES